MCYKEKTEEFENKMSSIYASHSIRVLGCISTFGNSGGIYDIVYETGTSLTVQVIWHSIMST